MMRLLDMSWPVKQAQLLHSHGTKFCDPLITGKTSTSNKTGLRTTPVIDHKKRSWWITGIL